MPAVRREARSTASPHPGVRAWLLAVLLSAISLTALAASTLLTVAFTDYEEEALPSVDALINGHVGGFLAHLPAYGGSLVMRAPAALVASAFGGGELAVYRALAAPCLLAVGVFGLVLWAHVYAERRSMVAASIALAVVVVNPVMLPALDTGHPEEFLGAVLCAGGVAAALRDRPLLAGLLVGFAGANKAWAVLAVVPALMALRSGRMRFLVVAGGVAAAILAAPLIHGTSAVGSASTVANGTGQIFQPWQWAWFAGDHHAVVHGVYGVKPGYRTGPGWVASVGHLPVVVVPIFVAGLAWLRRRRREDALLVLALCFLLRCVLDPWDTAYYHLPFLTALAAHEALARHRAPVGTAVLTVAVYVTTVMTRGSLSPDAQAALYLAWSVPTVALGVLTVAARERTDAVAGRVTRTLASALPSLSRVLAGPEAQTASPALSRRSSVPSAAR